MAKKAKGASPPKKLTTAQETTLIKTLNNFGNWLREKKIIKDLSHIDHVVDMPFANADWVMKVDTKKSSISFNTYVFQKCSFEYYQSILVHEFFHLAVQKVPNKEDATRVKDDFGEPLMKLIDIEADFFTALFFKEKLGYSLVKYLELYFEGSTVFSDNRIRTSKLERFIGTLLSISKMFIDHPKASQKVTDCDLYLPTITPVYTESSLHVLVIRKEHIYFDEIQAEYGDFVQIKECYTNVDTLTKKGYIEHLLKFVCKAFNITLPEKIKAELDNL